MTLKEKEVTLKDVVTVLEQSRNTFDELLIWIKVDAIQKVKGVLMSALDSPEKIIVYHLSDGNTTADIEKKCGVSDSQVSRYQKKWQKLGLMKKIASKGRGDRHVKVFDLEDFDMEIPKDINKEKKDKQIVIQQANSNASEGKSQ